MNMVKIYWINVYNCIQLSTDEENIFKGGGSLRKPDGEIKTASSFYSDCVPNIGQNGTRQKNSYLHLVCPSLPLDPWGLLHLIQEGCAAGSEE